MNFTIKHCERAEYQEFLNMLNKAFGYKDGDEWFEKNVPHCTPYAKDALDNEITKNYIAVSNEKIIGAVGAYPVEWTISLNRKIFIVKAFGIGQVSCLSEYRNKGVMTALLNHTKNEMVNSGCVISFLGGDRFRYSHFGYDFGGNTVKFNLEKYRFEKILKSIDLNTKTASITDYNELNQLYQNLPSFLKRNEQTWKRHIESYNHEFIIGNYNEKKGYICVRDNKVCVEVSGDSDIVLNLINKYMREHNLNSIEVQYPYTQNLPNNELEQKLYKVASWVNVSPYGLVAIHNSDKLINMLSNIIEKQANINVKYLDDNQKEALIRKLFGYVYQPVPECIKDFNINQPLCAWIPKIDDI